MPAHTRLRVAFLIEALPAGSHDSLARSNKSRATAPNNRSLGYVSKRHCTEFEKNS